MAEIFFVSWACIAIFLPQGLALNGYTQHGRVLVKTIYKVPIVETKYELPRIRCDSFMFTEQSEPIESGNGLKWYWVAKDIRTKSIISKTVLSNHLSSYDKVVSVVSGDTEYVICLGMSVRYVWRQFDVIVFNCKSKTFQHIYAWGNSYDQQDKDSISIDGIKKPFIADCYVNYPNGKPPQNVIDYVLTSDTNIFTSPPKKVVDLTGKEFCSDYVCMGDKGIHLLEEFPAVYDAASFLKLGLTVNEPYITARKKLLKKKWKIVNYGSVYSKKYPEMDCGNTSCSVYMHQDTLRLCMGLDSQERISCIGYDRYYDPTKKRKRKAKERPHF